MVIDYLLTEKWVATAPTVYGIETFVLVWLFGAWLFWQVATAPTVYGIETPPLFFN